MPKRVLKITVFISLFSHKILASSTMDVCLSLQDSLGLWSTQKIIDHAFMLVNRFLDLRDWIGKLIQKRRELVVRTWLEWFCLERVGQAMSDDCVGAFCAESQNADRQRTVSISWR
jgi:hypothetical protein